MPSKIPEGNWFEVTRSAFDHAMGKLELVDLEDPRAWPCAWELGATLLRESLHVTGSFGDGLHVFAKKTFEGKSCSGSVDIFDSEVRAALGDHPGDGAEVYLEWINDFVGDLCVSEPNEGEKPLTLVQFRDMCTIEMDVRQLDQNDPDGDLPLTPEEQHETGVMTGVLEALVLYFNYLEFLEALEG